MNYKSRKITLLLFITVLFLITSFVVNASAQNIWFTNIWYKKLPNYTHLTIKASGAISEYEVSYLEAPERIIIDVKNANYSIDELVKNILFLNMGSVKQVRCGQFESEPIPITRFVVDLFQKSDYEVKLSSDNRLVYVDVYDYTEFTAPEEQVFTVTPVKGEAVKIEKEEEPKISILDTYTEPVNLNIFEEDVVNVIRGLSELTGIDIMLDDTVTGQLTLNLKDKTFRETIELIMMNKGLDYTEVSETLIIAAKDVVAGYKRPVTRVYELKNASAEAAKGILDGYVKEGAISIVADARMNTLIVTGTNEEIEKVEGILSTIDEELLTKTFKIDNATFIEEVEAIKSMLGIIISDESRITIDSRQNEIIIKGSQEEIANAETMIEGLDKRAAQIMIESKIVEISLDAEKDLGISWSSGSSTDTEGNLIQGQISFGELTLGGSFERSGLIQATLNALIREGESNILSNPKILTLDGKKAIILSGSKIPIREITADGIETIRYLDVGLNMTITPRLSMDDKITMDCDIKVESLGTELIQGYPVINSRQEQAIIRSPLGVTNVIGGLITSEEIETIRRIPIFSKIPIFGELFKFTNRTKKKTEIIILITAHRIEY